MKKLYSAFLAAIFLLGYAHSSLAQNPNTPHRLGDIRSFSRQVRSQLLSSANNRNKAGLTLAVSAKEELPLKINFQKSESESNQYLVGEIGNKEASSFFLTVNGSTLEGNVILTKEKRAFKYYSDDKGNAYVEPVDINSVVCVEYNAAPVAKTTAVTPAAIGPAVASLQSFPGANGCVLLDFDGYASPAGSRWNKGVAFNAAAPNISDAAIQEFWELVSEDFRPFSLNITTSEAVFNSYPQNRRMRCVVTPTNTAAPGAGGVAYVNSFSWNEDTPCWVFMSSPKAGGEAASHEVGHTLGLGHDGRTNPSEGYYTGQDNNGNWAPIMGAGYYKSVTHWSKGEYNNANNKQDDLAIISGSTFGLGYRNDDHSNTSTGATGLARNGASVSGSGIIERTSDIDFFSFTAGAGTINLSVNTVSRHGDLDVLVRLYNASGALIGTYNPAGLNASVSANVAAGTYYLSVDGTGAGDPATSGYSDYASLGSFFISGTVPVSGSAGGVVTVYKDCNYGGYAVELPVGDYTLSQLNARGILDNDISSFRVTAGYEVLAYDSDNFGGTTYSISGDVGCLVDYSTNDIFSSLRVRVKPAASATIIQAESYNNMLGVITEGTADTDGGSNVGYIDTGDWMVYNSITFPTSGSYLVEYRVASPNGGGQLSVDLNAGATVLGTLSIPSTGGWQNWTTISHTVTVTAGTYNLGVFASTGGWNLNWVRVTKQGAARLAQSKGEELATAERMDVYPNPTAEQLHIRSAHPVAASPFQVIDARGEIVLSGTLQGASVDVSSLKPGIYSLVVKTEDNQRLIRRFVKQ